MLDYYLNVSENCQKYQYDSFLTVLCMKNVSVKLHKCVRNVSFDSFLTVFGESSLEMFHVIIVDVSEISQK